MQSKTALQHTPLHSIQHSIQAMREAHAPQQFPPLESVTRPAVDTAAAAYYLNRRPQTMRGWASAETFPDGMRPLRVNGRLAWPVAGIRRVLGLSA